MVNLAYFQLQELVAEAPGMQRDMGKRMTGLVYFKGDGKWVMLMGVGEVGTMVYEGGNRTFNVATWLFYFGW